MRRLQTAAPAGVGPGPDMGLPRNAVARPLSHLWENPVQARQLQIDLLEDRMDGRR